jgi:serine/threonine protein kinase
MLGFCNSRTYLFPVIHSGEVLDGYRTIRCIGAGGFGEVWLCRNEAFGDLRALKFIPASDKARLDREHAALCKYREESGKLLNKALMPIEHANLRADGMFYIMPLADGTGSDDPADELWRPLSLAALIKERAAAPAWFSSGEVRAFITPVFTALQMLDDARLVHRDVKPENILFRNGSPCLSDISLLNDDLTDRSRSGTYGYGAPLWYLDAGGHPDMYAAAATLFVLLTGKSPDKIAQSRHRWPPQGEDSLLEDERREWRNIHRLIARATDHDAERRFLSFNHFERTLNPTIPEQVPKPVREEIRRLEEELENIRRELKEQRDEFERVSESTMKALEAASNGKAARLAAAGRKLAAVAEGFETGLTAAKSGVHWIKALDVAKRAARALTAAGDKHGPLIGAGFEELRSGVERILKRDREFRVSKVREVLAGAVSLSMSGIGSLRELNASAKLAGLLGAGQAGGILNVAGLIAPAVLKDAQVLKGVAASVARIIESAKGFLEDHEGDFSGPAERSAKN